MHVFRLATILWLIATPQFASADGVNAGLADPTVVPATPTANATRQAVTSALRTDPTTGQALIFGSNQVGRPGVAPDQIGGYDVNVAYDHVAVGAAIIGVLFVMTEWMSVR